MKGERRGVSLTDVAPLATNKYNLKTLRALLSGTHPGLRPPSR